MDKSWKSFFCLKQTGGIENPNPPRYKQAGIPITYMQNGIVHEQGNESIRLTISAGLKKHMESAFGIRVKYLYLKNSIFKSMKNIKQIHLYPPKKTGECQMLVVYEVPEVEIVSENGHYLSIDLGLHNLLTCYDSGGNSFIVGRKYLSICRKYDKEIARIQSQWACCQISKGEKHPRPSGHVSKLYRKKQNCIRDYLHKITRYVVKYCKEHQIHRVIIGNITGIRKGKNLGKKTNQKLHSLPYAKIQEMLEYKLLLEGIGLIKQNESYSSQCSPFVDKVSKETAVKSNRETRGLYTDRGMIFQADAVGAYNILRKYFAVSGIKQELSVSGLSNPKVVKVAV